MSNRFISLDSPTLAQACPAIFATAPAEKVSAAYTFVPTHEVLRTLESHGWGITSAKQQKAFKSDPSTGKHMVSMRHRDHSPVARELGALQFQVNLVNSHDWSSRLNLSLGMFRLVCTNGLIASVGDYVSYNVRHDNIREDVETVLARINSGSQRMLSVVQSWAEIKVDPLEFGRKAAKIRFETLEGTDLDVAARNMVEVRRATDAENTLWNVYNRAQEAGMRGGFRVRQRAARQISNIRNEYQFNENLWQLAENFAAGTV